MCVVNFKPGQTSGYPRPVRNHCPCDCPIGLIRQGCDHLMNYPESAQGITQVTPAKRPIEGVVQAKPGFSDRTEEALAKIELVIPLNADDRERVGRIIEDLEEDASLDWY